MWIRILGILYNLSLVQAIEYSTKDKMLYLYHGACGAHNVRHEYSNPVMDTTEISFDLPQYDNDYGLTVYKSLMVLLRGSDVGPPYEGAHSDQEFIDQIKTAEDRVEQLNGLGK